MTKAHLPGPLAPAPFGVLGLLGLLAGMLIATSLPAAEGDRHVLRWKSATTLEVRSTVMTQSSCYVAGRSAASAPTGESIPPESLPLTLALQHTSHYACVAIPTPVHFRSRMEVPAGRQRLTIYLRDGRSGQVRFTERSLPRRPGHR